MTDRDESYERYLLGELPEAERERLEEEFFADDEAFEQLLAVSDELLDRHARGELSGPRLRRFEEHFLSTAPRRRRAREAKELVEFSTRLAAAEARAPARERGPSRRTLLLGALGSQSPALRFASVALLLFAALAGAWLLFRRADDDKTRRAAATPSPATEAIVRSTPDRVPQPQREDAETPAPTPSPAPPAPNANATRTPRATPVAPQPRAAQVASILLTPVHTRGGGAANTLLIRPGTNAARLRLSFKGDGHRRYFAVVRTIDGEQVWRGGASPEPSTRAAGQTAAVNVPARVFRKRDHTVTLYGVTAAGETQEINEYFFTVSRGEAP